MMAVVTEFFFILLLVFLNGLFALSEISILSARKTRLEQLSNQGNKGAKIALELANNPNKILSTVQIGITTIGIFAGAYGGASLADNLAIFLKKLPFLGAHSQFIALGIVVVALTYLSLIIGELVPKRLALSDPEGIASFVAIPLRHMSALMAPVVHVLSFSTNFVLRLLGVRIVLADPLVTEDEIKVLLKQGKEAGMFEAAEHEMVERVLKLNDRTVRTLMTPRLDIRWLNLEDSAEINRNKIINSSHTRFPVCQGSLDEALGIVQATYLLGDCLNGKPFDLTVMLRSPLYVPESTKGLRVLESFQQSGSHIALVVDEYGVVQGLITINDILKAIVGDLPRIDRRAALQILEREDGSWLIDGSVAIEELEKRFVMADLPNAAQGNFYTLGGFVVAYLGKIPDTGDTFVWKNFRFEVVDMDGNRVDKVLMTPLFARTSREQ